MFCLFIVLQRTTSTDSVQQGIIPAVAGGVVAGLAVLIIFVVIIVVVLVFLKR